MLTVYINRIVSILIIILIIILTIVLIYDLYTKKSKEYFNSYNKIDLTKYKIHHHDKDCILRCGTVSDCVRLDYQTKNYLKCKKCKKNKTNIYQKMITGYDCDSEDMENNYLKQSVKCDYNDDLSCPNYNDISNPGMIQPYYIIPKDTSKVLSNTGLCQFCWNLN